MSTPEQILSDFIDAWNAGDGRASASTWRALPDVRERDELAEQITTWLETAPTPDYDDATRAAVRAEPVVARLFEAADSDAGLWPTLLPDLRERAGLSRDSSPYACSTALSLKRSETGRATGYLERLEAGTLDPTRVSRRLLDALGAVLGAPGRALADSATLGRAFGPASAGGTLFRTGAAAEEWLREDIENLSWAALSPAPPPMDELERLFTGGPDA